jgi:hypothetical protein
VGSAPDPPPRQEGGTDPPAAGDLLAEAAAELYGADPQEFTDRRKALSAAAKAAGDAAAAKQIAALRKPTRAAWVVNSLVRAAPEAPGRLASLSAALRAAEQAKDGQRLRELSAERGRLVDSLADQAMAAAAVADPPAGLREEVAATLTAALADPEVTAAFAAGTLTRAAEWAGFGLALPEVPDTGDAEPAAVTEPVVRPVPLTQGRRVRERARPPEEDEAQPAGKAGRREGPAGERRLRLAGGTETEDRDEDGTARRGGSRGTGTGERDEDGAARRGGEAARRRERLAEERVARLAQEAAEEAVRAADRRRKIFEDAERAVASAAAAASDAVAEEDRLEVEVRDLELRLTQARADLADIRLRARRAETAERKARQVLDRLPPPDDPE